MRRRRLLVTAICTTTILGAGLGIALQSKGLESSRLWSLNPIANVTVDRAAVRTGVPDVAKLVVPVPPNAAPAAAPNPAGNLDQCANGGTTDPPNECDTNASQWVNGNLNEAKAHYLEGDSIAYRLRMSNLTPGGDVHTVTIEWDTLKQGKHALDYLTSVDRTMPNVNPCLGVTGCSGPPDTWPIPLDPLVSAGGVTQIPGDFWLYGGTITNVSAYSTVQSGDFPTSITISFQASVENPVLAWGGHISTRQDWGVLNSAINIPGSPYHMRFLDLDGQGGNQDRSLSASAVFFPASLTIVKETLNGQNQPVNNSDNFTFTGTGTDVSGFSLNTSTPPTSNTKVFTLTDTSQRVITEGDPSPAYALTSLVCVVTPDPLLGGTGGTAVTDLTARTSTVTPQEGASIVCTYTNKQQPAKLIVIKHVINDNGGTKVASDFTMHVKRTAGDATDLAGGPGAESPGTEYTIAPGTYVVSEDAVTGYTQTSASADCSGTLTAGQTKTCTITNNDNAPALHLRKVVTNDNGGTATVADFTLSAAGPTPLSGTSPVDSGASFDKGTYALSETPSLAATGKYTASAWVCVGGTQVGSNITVDLGESATCTITNDDNAPGLHLRKVVTNDNGGTATVADFTLSAAGPTPLSGTSPVDSGASFDKGTYALSETPSLAATGKYTASAWVCVGGTQVGSNITVDLGQSATCTITNNDIAPKLHLRKVVINNNGGTAGTADFTLIANGAGSNDLSGTSPVDSGAGLLADTWALSETGPWGYAASSWVCVGGTQVGSNITVGIGGEATCTITNDDQPGTIIVQKVSKPVNSGSFDFTTTGTGYSGFTIAGGAQNSQQLNAGSYTVQEALEAGWLLTGIGGSSNPSTPYNCTITGSGGSTGVGSLATRTATIELKIGDTVTCVFENTGQQTTRTQGFWATHPQLAELAWFGGTGFDHTFPGVANVAEIGDTLICGMDVATLGDLMGGFWSRIPRTSTGVRRTELDQARMQLLQQLLAAELNASAFGSAPVVGTFADWEAALCGTDIEAIKEAQQQAASFNTSGDSGIFTPGTSADAKAAREIADLLFWDVWP